MADLFGHEGFRNNADNMAARRHYGVSDHAHEAYISSTIDELGVAARQLGACLFCGIGVNRMGTVAGATENAEASE